jgi:hypothetical protein
MSTAMKMILDLRRRVPKIHGCPKGCSRCCGPVPFALPEWSRVPHRKATRTTCPYVENDRCAIYESRPITCRLFGYEGLSEARLCENAGMLHSTGVSNLAIPAKDYAQRLWIEYHMILGKWGIHGPFAETFKDLEATLRATMGRGGAKNGNEPGAGAIGGSRNGAGEEKR